MNETNEKSENICRYFRMIMFLGMVFFASGFHANGQQPLPPAFLDSAGRSGAAVVNCGVDITLDILRRSPEFRDRENRMNEEILRALNKADDDDTLILPVVVHIVNTNPYAITDAQVIAGIQLLNDAFGKSGAYSSGAGVDTKIRFCIARTDPDSGITTGITRTTSYFSNTLNKEIEDAKLKNLIQWDPKKYINIWLISGIKAEAYADFICGNWYRLGVSGYATLPPNAGALDGIVVTGFGNLLAHEMGHYLGLYHTFEGGCTNNNCLTDGDRVCDTPPDNSVRPSPNCATPENSCSTDTLSNYSNGNFYTDVPDQISNFMDYGNGSCGNQFTQGQADRMRAAVVTQRAGLLAPACDPPCNENIIAGFTRDIAYSVTGNTIHFTNTSAGAVNYEWLVNDTVVSTSVDFSYTFDREGKDKITLKAFNTPGCFASYTGYVITGCGVTARFYTDKQFIASKLNIYEDSILFSNTSYHATSFQWLIRDPMGIEQVVSADTDLRYIFPGPGNYRVRLIAANGSCSDTTEYYTVPVADPTADGSVFNSSMYCYNGNKVRVSFCIADYGYASIPKGTPVSFYDADPRTPGAHLISPVFYLPDNVPGGNCYKCFNHVLDIPYSGLERIFISVNDSGTAIPVVFPGTLLVEKNYSNNVSTANAFRSTIIASICDGQNYAGYTKSGTYTDTLVSKITGCDSIRTLILTVNPVVFTTVTTSICQGDNYAGHTASGTYVDVYSTTKGCDSTRTLFLTVKPTFKTSVTVVLCEGESYYGHTRSGIYTDHYNAVNGCDSARTVYLTVNPVSRTTTDVSVCDGQTYFAAGDFQTRSGTYYDTLTNYLGCDSIITTNLTVHPVPQPDLGNDRVICMGDIVVLDPGTFTSYQWQDGSTNSTFPTYVPGYYSVKVTNIYSCTASAGVNLLRIAPKPKDFLRSDTSLCRGNTVRLGAGGFMKYVWNTGETKSFIDVKIAGLYKLEATDFNGCTGVDSVQIGFYECKDVWIPNAYTPNNDGLNESFRPIFPAPVTNYRFRIYNRYGGIVFESTILHAGWDGRYKGTDQPAGVYAYTLTFTDIDGHDRRMQGPVVLIR